MLRINAPIKLRLSDEADKLFWEYSLAPDQRHVLYFKKALKYQQTIGAMRRTTTGG